MMNKVILIGRITKDPELRYTNSNIPYVQFTLAVNRRFADQQGNRETDFIYCTTWRNQAENLARYIKKGALLGIEGQLQVNSYDDQNGVRRTSTNVVCDNIQFLEPRGSSSEYKSQDYQRSPYQYEKPQSSHSGGYSSRNPFSTTEHNDEPRYEHSSPEVNPFSNPSSFNVSYYDEPSSKENNNDKKDPFEETGKFNVSNDDLPF